MSEKRPAETSTEEPVPKKPCATDISNDTEKSDASETTKTSSVTREPQIKQESRPKHFFPAGKKYLCPHCPTAVIITLNVDSHTFQCMTCNNITHFNDYCQKFNVIHEKLIQNMEFSWSQLRESNQLNIEKNKKIQDNFNKNQDNFNKMKEYFSSIDKFKDEIREYDKAICDCENGNNLKVELFLKRKIRHLEYQITSIKKEVETLTVS